MICAQQAADQANGGLKHRHGHGRSKIPTDERVSDPLTSARKLNPKKKVNPIAPTLDLGPAEPNRSESESESPHLLSESGEPKRVETVDDGDAQVEPVHTALVHGVDFVVTET